MQRLLRAGLVISGLSNVLTHPQQPASAAGSPHAPAGKDGVQHHAIGDTDLLTILAEAEWNVDFFASAIMSVPVQGFDNAAAIRTVSLDSSLDLDDLEPVAPTTNLRSDASSIATAEYQYPALVTAGVHRISCGEGKQSYGTYCRRRDKARRSPFFYTLCRPKVEPLPGRPWIWTAFDIGNLKTEGERLIKSCPHTHYCVREGPKHPGHWTPNLDSPEPAIRCVPLPADYNRRNSAPRAVTSRKTEAERLASKRKSQARWYRRRRDANRAIAMEMDERRRRSGNLRVHPVRPNHFEQGQSSTTTPTAPPQQPNTSPAIVVEIPESEWWMEQLLSNLAEPEVEPRAHHQPRAEAMWVDYEHGHEHGHEHELFADLFPSPHD